MTHDYNTYVAIFTGLKYFSNECEEQRKFYELKGANMYEASGFTFSKEYDALEQDYRFFNHTQDIPAWADPSWSYEEVADELERRMTAMIRSEYQRYTNG